MWPSWQLITIEELQDLHPEVHLIGDSDEKEETEDNLPLSATSVTMSYIISNSFKSKAIANLFGPIS